MAEDYDPHLYRVVKKPTNDFETLVHFLKGYFGTGILALPEGFKYSGMINGIISTILICLLISYCLHLLVGSQYLICKRHQVPYLTYPEAMRVALEMGPTWMIKFAKYAAHITIFFLVFNQIGNCCVYIIFVAKNIKYVADYHTPEPIMYSYYILMIFIPCLLIFMIPDFKMLAKFLLFANIITLGTFGTVFYYVFRQGLPNFMDRPAFGEGPMDYAFFFGTVMFGCQSIGVNVSIEMNMETPKSFLKPLGVLNIGMFIVTVVHAFFGAVGYWKYGEEIKSSITINFPIMEILAQVIILAYAFAIYLSYSLQAYVPVVMIWTEYIEERVEEIGKWKKIFYEYLLRLGILILTFTLALTVPLLGHVISLLGCFALSALGVIFPAILDVCSHWPEESHIKTFRFWKSMIIIFIGMVALICGTYSTIYGIVEELKFGEDIY